MTNRPKTLAAADVLRVACIAIVAWYHFWQQSWLDPGFHIGSYYVNLQQMIRHGYMAVDVILVLSGFLLALPYARCRTRELPLPSAGAFYRKRFWRIVPSYVLAILLVLFLWAIPRGLYASTDLMIKDLLAHLTFTHIFSMETYVTTPLLVVLWTVAVEVQFYLLFPLFGVFYKDYPGLTCMTLTLAALAMRLWVSHQTNLVLLINQMPCMLDLFACGMAGASIYAHWENRPIKPGMRWILAGGAAVSFLLIMQVLYLQPIGDYDIMRRHQLIWRLPLALLGSAFLVCGSLAPEGLSRVFGNRATRFLAAISYNFYIWHQFLATTLKTLHIPPYASESPNQAYEQPWQLLYTLTCFAVSGLVAAAVTYLWEKPLHRFGTRKLR